MTPWLAIPLLVGLYLSSQQRRRAYAVRFTNLALLGQVMGKGPGFRRHLPAILFIAGVAGLLLSIAGPQATIRIPKGQTSVMLAVDVSGSMAATDVQPTRIEAAIAAGRTLIDKLPSNAQVGLVIFNSQAEVIAQSVAAADIVARENVEAAEAAQQHILCRPTPNAREFRQRCDRFGVIKGLNRSKIGIGSGRDLREAD